jgi:hypothetical protein
MLIQHTFDVRVVLQHASPKQVVLMAFLVNGGLRTWSRELGWKGGRRSNAKFFTGIIFSSQVVKLYT